MSWSYQSHFFHSFLKYFPDWVDVHVSFFSCLHDQVNHILEQLQLNIFILLRIFFLDKIVLILNGFEKTSEVNEVQNIALWVHELEGWSFLCTWRELKLFHVLTDWFDEEEAVFEGGCFVVGGDEWDDFLPDFDVHAIIACQGFDGTSQVVFA